GSGGADRAPLAHALEAAGHHGRRRLQVPDLGRRHVVGLRQRVVHQRRREELAVVAVDDAFEQRLADPLRDGAVDLALDDQRVDDGAAVLDEGVASEPDARRLAIDLDDGDVHGGRERRPRGRPPRGATSVSTARTRTASMEMPRRSATSCAIVVAWPWPCDGKLVTQLTVPSAPIVTVAASMPGTSIIPRRRNTSAPMPV